MGKEITQGIRFTLVAMVLLGGGYHVVLWAVGRVAFPSQAEGSLIRRDDGTIVGSRLIAQTVHETRGTSTRARRVSTTTPRRPAARTTGPRILIT